MLRRRATGSRNLCSGHIERRGRGAERPLERGGRCGLRVLGRRVWGVLMLLRRRLLVCEFSFGQELLILFSVFGKGIYIQIENLSNLEQARGCSISEGLAKGVLVEDSPGPVDRHNPAVSPGASRTVGRSAEEGVPWRTPAEPRNPSVP